MTASRRINLDTIPFVFGLEDMLQSVNWSYPQNTYPPYNILQDKNKYTIEVAVAGFCREELDVVREKNQLFIKGSKVKETEYQSEYLHKGLSTRDFDLRFKLDASVAINAVTVKDGILVVEMEKIVPENEKPVKFKID